MHKYKVLLIGLGRIGSLLEKDKLRYHPCTHAGVLFSPFGKKNFEVSGILDIRTERIQNFIYDWHLENKINITTESAVSKGEFDLAVIASDTESHFANAVFAINHGIKNLLIEKPVTINLTEVKKLLQLQKKFKVNVWVNHERRYHPLYRQVREWIQAEKYGKLKTIKASVLTNALQIAKNRVATSPLFHDGTHAIDYIHWLIGKPVKVNSRAYKSNKGLSIDDHIIANLEYSSGVNVFLEVGGMREYFQFEIDIQTTKARIVLSNDGSKLFVSKQSSLYENFKSLAEVQFPLNRSVESNPFIAIYKEILEFLKNGGGNVTGSLEDNFAIMDILTRIEKAGEG